jgi:hypothetical protein
MSILNRHKPGVFFRDSSDEPRLTPTDAARLLVESTTREQTESIMGLVRPRDRRKAARAAAHLQQTNGDQTRRATWSDRPLPFPTSNGNRNGSGGDGHG